MGVMLVSVFGDEFGRIDVFYLYFVYDICFIIFFEMCCFGIVVEID